jgi:hypothetical protein
VNTSTSAWILAAPRRRVIGSMNFGFHPGPVV